MDLKKNKEIKLYILFLKYLGIFSFNIIILISVFMTFFIISLNKGFILPANYAENKIKENKDILIESEPFDKSAVPFTCSYGLFDKDNNYIEGSFEDNDIKEGLKVLNNKSFINGRYIVINRQNENCVIKYDVKAHFSSPNLHGLISNPEAFTLSLFMILFFLILFIMAVLCGKKIKMALKPLLDATENIKNEDLEFKIEYSGIKEFNDVLRSIDDMKNALEKSLREQWKIEQNKKNYISALAHDIKTPLTIIKGNCEIINEESDNEEIKEYSESINNNCERIQEYITLLIESVKSGDIIKCNFKEVMLNDVIKDIIKQGKEICNVKNMIFEYEFEDNDYKITCDKQSIVRAILNLIENAVSHSEEKQKVVMNIFVKTSRLYIIIDDFGCGFTKEALINAKNEFFTENRERSRNHYGLGMYIADAVAKSHGGNLEYINKEREKGARVWIEVPLSHC